jgi:hypothetical protein
MCSGAFHLDVVGEMNQDELWEKQVDWEEKKAERYAKE